MVSVHHDLSGRGEEEESSRCSESIESKLRSPCLSKLCFDSKKLKILAEKKLVINGIWCNFPTSFCTLVILQ
jgi:hypothetical protein